MFSLLLANEKGEMMDYPLLEMTGRTGSVLVEPLPEEMIPLPEGASLTLVPYSIPVGMDKDGNFVPVEYNPYNDRERVYPVGALLPQGFTRLLLPGGVGTGEQLPLLGYTAVGVKDGQFYVAALQTDEHRRWHPRYFNTEDLEDRVAKLNRRFAHNRIVKQLSRCALEYGCFTAQNLFYGRWEAGIPVSPACNARCLGCISLQESECCPSPQERIEFIPSVEEIAELALYFFSQPDAEIISFGQGCEGEPSLQADLLSAAIKSIRSQTLRGTININTNAGYTEGIKKLCDSGLDAIRVSILSAIAEHYQAYYRPKGYTLKAVEESLQYAASKGVYTSLNLLVFPGFSDTEEQIKALVAFVKRTHVRMIQLRNLNIDPDIFCDRVNTRQDSLGMLTMINTLRQELPDVKIGNYSKPLQKIHIGDGSDCEKNSS
ncbi:MAG: radical SAM protein [Thermoanaerobacteraceae bacterium]|nr:radical SAM protein [Thermoanaerobacteraceae bacterium]